MYHIVVDPKTNVSKFNRYQAECVIPWVNEVLLLLTIALQAAQQLKDKVYDESNNPQCCLFTIFFDTFLGHGVFAISGFSSAVSCCQLISYF